MKRLAFVPPLLLISSLSLAAALKGAVISPEPGIICDKKGGFCADSQGISMALTKRFLGDKAEKKLMGMGVFDTSTFTLTNGVHCAAKTQTCTAGKWNDKVEAAHTKALFGK